MKDVYRIVEKIDKFNNKLVDNIVKANEETAKIICDDVKELAPKDTGKYAESIKVGETTINRNTISTEVYTDMQVVSKRDGDKYNLGFLLETGTSPHLIVPVDAQYLHFQIDGKDIFTKMVYHPGMVAQPHFSKGLYMNRLVYKQKLNKAIIDSFK